MRTIRNYSLAFMFVLLWATPNLLADEGCEVSYGSCVFPEDEDAALDDCLGSSTMQMCIDAGGPGGGACERSVGVELYEPAHPNICGAGEDLEQCEPGMIFVHSGDFTCHTVPLE